MAKQPKTSRWRQTLSLPMWLVSLFVLVATFNVIIFLAVGIGYFRPDMRSVPVTGDVALGMHLQLFEAILSALAIGLAVFGFVGYGAVREAAERRAEDAAREVAQKYFAAAKPAVPLATEPAPDLSGLDFDIKPGDRVQEEKI